MRKAFVWAVVLVAFVALAGCGSGGGGFSKRAQAGKESTFRYPIVLSPTTLDPHKVEDGDTIDLLQQIFEGLVTWDDHSQVTGAVAEKWDIQDGGKTYVFKLRAGVKFHNGRAVTADDVKWSYERATNPKLASSVAATYLSDIVGVKEKLAGTAKEVTGIKVLAPDSIEMRLTRPVSFFLPKLTYLVGAVLPKESVPADGPITSVDQMIGTGPFKAKSYATDQLFVLEANKDYARGKPQIDFIERPVIKDAATRLLKFKNGELDLVQLERGDVPGLQADPKFKDQLHFFDRPAIWYFAMAPNAYEPFKNRSVRRAFAMAVDRDQIVKQTLGGLVNVANAILPPNVPGHRDATAVLKFDPAAAKAELAKGGYPDPSKLPPLELNYRVERPDARLAAEDIAAQLKKNLGVTVNLRSMEYGAMLEKKDRGQLQLYHMRWAADYLDPENFLTTLLSTTGAENKMGYSNPAFDALCAAGDVMPPGPEREKKYQEAEDLMLQDAPFVPIYFQRDTELVNPRVSGLLESAFGHLPHVGVKLAAKS